MAVGRKPTASGKKGSVGGTAKPGLPPRPVRPASAASSVASDDGGGGGGGNDDFIERLKDQMNDLRSRLEFDSEAFHVDLAESVRSLANRLRPHTKVENLLDTQNELDVLKREARWLIDTYSIGPSRASQPLTTNHQNTNHQSHDA